MSDALEENRLREGKGSGCASGGRSSGRGRNPGDAERGALRGQVGPAEVYLNRDDPRQGLAGVGAALDGNAQGGRTLLHADEGGCGLQESRLWV